MTDRHAQLLNEIGATPTFRTVDGVSIRFVESDRRDTDALLLSPWPESVFAYEPTWARLAEKTHLVAIDLPGFGRSERRDALMTPRAMGEFIVRAADAFRLERPHVVGPDIGTSAALFAAAAHSDRFLSLVVGTGGAAVPLQLGDPLREWVLAPDLEPYRRIGGRAIVGRVIRRSSTTPSATLLVRTIWRRSRAIDSRNRSGMCSRTRRSSKHSEMCCCRYRRRCRSFPAGEMRSCRS